MTHTIEKVRVFHQTFGHPVSAHVSDMTPELRCLRIRLIAEELGELATAWGVSLSLRVNTIMPEYDRCEVEVRAGQPVDHVEGADALGDLDYVVQGANLVAGYPAEAVLDEIQASNMSKLGENGKPLMRADGKILKGPGYFPPTPGIAKVLRTAGWQGDGHDPLES